MSEKSISDELAEKKDWITDATETRPLWVFGIIFGVSLILGTLLFVVILQTVPSWVPGWWKRIELDTSGAGGFLQGAWGTAGSLAASFVAIVLAQQALALTKRQDKYKTIQDKESAVLQQEQQQLQREQNRILQQNTPEYQIAYRAAMSSTKLDSLQILIGNSERKKFRGLSPTLADVLKTHEPKGDEVEIKTEIKNELLSSRFIGFTADVAEKMFGTNRRLEIETLASELILSSKPTLEKLLINRLNDTVHSIVTACMEDIKRVLKESSSFAADPVIFRFAEYEALKSTEKSEGVRGGVSKSAFYFVNVLSAQMRGGSYTYVEGSFFEKIIRDKIQKADPDVQIQTALPTNAAEFRQGLCVVTPFDFQRASLLVKLESTEGDDSASQQLVLETSELRGKPDLEIFRAINDKKNTNSIVFLDQIEGAQDSVEKGKWLTFTEHLKLWEGARRLVEVFDAQEGNYEFLVRNFIMDIKRKLPEALSPNEISTSMLESLLPRFNQVKMESIQTKLVSMSNYELIFRQVAKEFNKSSGKLEECVQQFLIKLFEQLKIMDESRISESFESFEKLCSDYKNVTVIIRELARRPFFERPFYGWIIPGKCSTSEDCKLLTAKDMQLGFVGVYYLLEKDDDFIFHPNSIYKWLVSNNIELESGSVLRDSVVMAL